MSFNRYVCCGRVRPREDPVNGELCEKCFEKAFIFPDEQQLVFDRPNQSAAMKERQERQSLYEKLTKKRLA